MNADAASWVSRVTLALSLAAALPLAAALVCLLRAFLAWREWTRFAAAREESAPARERPH